MQNLEIIDRLKVKITELFKDKKTGHDISHLKRVFENAMQIQKNEGGDFYVVDLSLSCNDLFRQ